ncbi:DMT family transporter [Pantoea sp. OXWO6B1]|uniref:DMT family transporter n=1 Tax=Pantoea sp. OXWO6B1 TaxID=1835724 RepID=UPI0007C85F56|nr:DMT family transporter [Pantoea sp. OXWO6B1]OAD97990.1 hypothetical protein A6A26_23845 [Pantoea sp. OXWO6B1]
MKNVKTFIIFMLVVLTWGTTWIAMKIAVTTIPPLIATGMRFLFASPFLILLCKLFKEPLIYPKGERIYQIIVTLFYFSAPFSLMIYGEKYVNPAVAAIIFSTMPAMILITSIMFLGKKTNCMQVMGLSFAMISLFFLICKTTNMTTPSQFKGVIALLFAALAHAIIYTLTKKQKKKVSVLTFNAIPCLTSGFLLIALGWATELANFSHFSKISIIATFYLGAVAGVFGILCYFYLQQKQRLLKHHWLSWFSHW